MGVRLLERSPQGVEPTVYGRALLDRGVAAFDELKQAVRHIEFLVDPTAGEVRIGASIAMSARIVSAVTDRLSRLHPKITFQVLSANSAATYRALQERKVDLVIVHIFHPFAEDHMNADILSTNLTSFCGRINPLTRRRKVELADLIEEPSTLPPPDSLFGGVVLRHFAPRDSTFLAPSSLRPFDALRHAGGGPVCDDGAGQHRAASQGEYRAQDTGHRLADFDHRRR